MWVLIKPDFCLVRGRGGSKVQISYQCRVLQNQQGELSPIKYGTNNLIVKFINVVKRRVVIVILDMLN